MCVSPSANLTRSVIVGTNDMSGNYNNISITDLNELFTNTLASNRAKSIQYDTGTVSSTEYILYIDLTDIVVWPHKQTGSINIDQLHVSVDFASSGSQCFIKIGVITRIDGTDADVSYLTSEDFGSQNARNSVASTQNFQPSSMSFAVSGGSLVNSITNDTDINLAAINTGITLDGPGGNVTPGVGDIIIKLDPLLNTFEGSVSAIYHSLE